MLQHVGILTLYQLMKYTLFNCIFQFSLWVLKCCYCIFTVKFWQPRCHFYCKFKKKFIRQESHTPHILATGVKQMSWKVLEYKAIFPPAGFRTPQPPTEESWERAIVLLPEEQQRTPPSSWECWKPLYDSRIDGRVEMGYIICSYVTQAQDVLHL